MFQARRLNTYVLGELLVPTLLGLALYTFTLLMNEFFLLARMAVSRNLAWDVTLRLFAYQIPKIFVMTIPMATLLGTLIGIGRLSADHEWVALQGAGLGPGFLVRPVALHGVLATLATFFVYAELVPNASYASRDLLEDVVRSSTLAADLHPRVFYDDLPGAVLFVDEIRPGSQGRLEGVMLYQSAQEGGSEQVILAKRGDLYPSPDRSGNLEVDLQDGVLNLYRTGTPDHYLVSRFDRYHLEFKPPEYMSALRAVVPGKTVQDMGPRDLFRELQAARAEKDPVLRSYRVRRVRAELHQRFALPVTCLLFAVLAMPLGVTRARSGKGAGFALSMAVILVYWLVFTVARNQAARGRFPLVLGVWAGNLVIAVWILYAYWRAPMMGGERSGLLARLADSFSPGPAFRRGAPQTILSADAASPGRVASPWRLLGLMDRYVVYQYLRLLALALLSAYLIYGLVELKSLLDGVFQNRQPVSLVGRYFKYFAPGMLQFTLPVACLVAGVVCFSLLARRGELTAMKASGTSMRRALAPVVGVTLVLCGMLFFIQDRIAPVTTRKAQEVRDQILGRAPRSYGVPVGGRWTFGSENRLYQYRLYDPVQKAFQGLSVFTLDRSAPRILEHRFAASARWNGSAWELEKGWYRSFPPGAPVGEYRSVEKPEAVVLDPPENFSRRETTLAVGGDLPDQMSLEDLALQIESLRDSGYDTTRLRVAYFAKIAQPFTPLVMLLLGLPFGFKVGRSGSLYAVGVSLLLVIVYWATLAIFSALGLERILPPLLAAWAPNVFYGLFGIYLLLYVRT